MIEARVPKDIRVYDTKLFGPLTFRQAVCVAITIGIDIVVVQSILIPFEASIETIIYTIMFVDVPIVALGFFKVLGLPMEVYIKNILMRYMVSPKYRRSKKTIVEKAKPSWTEKELKNEAKKLKKLEKTHPEYTAYM